jgi:hypothetical protein
VTSAAPDDPRADGLTLRRAGRDDDPALRRLNEASFPANPKARADITEWQYWANPFGDTVALVWDDAGQIVAQYVAYCVPGVLDGRPATLTIGVDAAVDPAYQGRRLFTPLSVALYRATTDGDTPLIAYPNEQSVRGIARAGWREVANLRVRLLPTDDRWLADRLHLPAPLAGALRRTATWRPGGGPHDVAIVDDVPDAVDGLWSRLAHHHPWGIAKHAAWWRWRYADHPDRPYRYLVASQGGTVRAVAATRTRDDLGGRFHCLLELLADDRAAAAALVRAVADGALGPADGVALTAVARSRLDRLAAGAGMLAPPKRMLDRPIHFGVVPHPTLVPDPTAVPWSTSWGDLDHI